MAFLRVHTQYGDRPLKTATGDDAKERLVPVHPELEALLTSWKCSGFEAVYGRPPKPEDFIAPDPKNMGVRTQGKSTKDLPKDARQLGIPNKGSHAFRRFFISAVRSGGARREVVEKITHNASGEIIDAYTTWEWSTLCEAVGCLQPARGPSGRDHDASQGQVRDISRDILPDTATLPCKTQGEIVEAVGIEESAIHDVARVSQRFREICTEFNDAQKHGETGAIRDLKTLSRDRLELAAAIMAFALESSAKSRA